MNTCRRQKVGLWLLKPPSSEENDSFQGFSWETDDHSLDSTYITFFSLNIHIEPQSISLTLLILSEWIRIITHYITKIHNHIFSTKQPILANKLYNTMKWPNKLLLKSKVNLPEDIWNDFVLNPTKTYNKLRHRPE